MADADTLRAYLGEKIPTGGTDADTFFSDAEITQLLADAASLYGAAAEGWRQKQGSLANLVNTSELGSSRSMSDLFKHAEKMITYYDAKAAEAEGTAGVTRIHTIVRPEPA